MKTSYVDLRAPDPRAHDHLGRTLTCTRCGAVVVVFELPRETIRAETFVGLSCCGRKVAA